MNRYRELYDKALAIADKWLNRPKENPMATPIPIPLPGQAAPPIGERPVASVPKPSSELESQAPPSNASLEQRVTALEQEVKDLQGKHSDQAQQLDDAGILRHHHPATAATQNLRAE